MKPIKKKALHGKCTYSVPLGLFLPRCFTFPVSWHPQLTAGVSQLTPLPPVAWPKAGWCRELQQRSCGSRPFGSSRRKGEKKGQQCILSAVLLGDNIWLIVALPGLFPRIVEESSQSYQFIFSVPKVFRVWHIVTSETCNK